VSLGLEALGAGCSFLAGHHLAGPLRGGLSVNHGLCVCPPTEDDEWHQLEQCHNLIVSGAQLKNKMEYSPQLAQVAARWIAEINGNVTTKGASFMQQYVLQNGLKKIRARGHKGAVKDDDQLHRRNCFTPLDVATLTLERSAKLLKQ
jgi:hypothetical protein